jgi:hypothetical protein
MGKHSLKVSNVSGTGIVVANESTVSFQSPNSAQTTAFEGFLELLDRHQTEVPDPAEIRGLVTALADETRKKKPKRQVVRSLFEKLAAGVAGVTVLADAVTKIEAAVHPFM